MNFENNIKLAKKYMVESIYRSANIEGIGVTFPETQTICDGMSIAGHTIDEISAVNDLKSAWQWYFANPNALVNAETLKTVNRLLGKYTVINAGCFRTEYDEPIRVPLLGGENFYPPLPPSEEEIDIKLVRIMDVGTELTADRQMDAAMEIFCYTAKGQFFNDGNKRTATIFTNIYMIQHGLGIFSIPVDKKLEFYNALTLFYADDSNKAALKEFLRSNCVT